MPKHSRLFVKPFIGGINTETSSVEDAILHTADELNCTILPEGIRGRRLGFNIERDGKWIESGSSTVSSIFYWDNVDKKDLDYIVVQRGTTLYFFIKDSLQIEEPLSIDLSKYQVTASIDRLRYSTCAGDLIVVGDWIDPVKISWNFDTSSFEVVKVNIKWRDLIGIDDGLDIDETPAELTPEHKYNLYNQGWDKFVYTGANSATKKDALTAFYDETSYYPSNNMLHYLDKTADSEYDTYEILKHFYGDTPAPKGHFILDYFSRSRTKASGIALEGAESINQKELFSFAKDDKDIRGYMSNIFTIPLIYGGSAKAEEVLENPDRPIVKVFLQKEITVSSVTFEIRDYADSNGKIYPDGVRHPEAKRSYDYLGIKAFAGPIRVSLFGRLDDEVVELKSEDYVVVDMESYVGSIFCRDVWSFEEISNYTDLYLEIELLGISPEEQIRLAPYWHIDITYTTDVLDLPSLDVVNGRIKDITTLGGRYFYLVGDTVLFSQVLKDNGEGFDACHQEADPTSEEISDVVPTDGGYVKFPAMGEGQAIESFNRGVIVFGKSNVFGIISPAEQVLTATSYDIVELSRAGLIGPESVVSTSDQIFYWSPLGIFRIGLHAETGNTVVAQSVSIDTIQEFYNNIPQFSKQNCVGSYDYVNNRIYWYYPTDRYNTHKLDGCLVLDLTYGSFMSFKIGDTSTDLPYISHVCRTPNAYEIRPTMYVRADGDRVIAGGVPVIAAEEESKYNRWTALKHVVLDDNNSFSFGDYNSREFKDFDKAGYDSYMVSRPIMFEGFSTFGNPINSTATDKQVPVLQTLFKRTEQSPLRNGKDYIGASGAYIRMRWGWSLDDRSNRWDMVQNGYRPQKDFLHDEYIESRIHVRGRGKAFQIEIRNNDNKDFRLAGMNLLVRSR